MDRNKKTINNSKIPTHRWKFKNKKESNFRTVKKRKKTRDF